MESWKKIKGYEMRYEVSDIGRIRRISDGKVMRPAKNKNGYFHIVLSKDGQPHDYRVHRIVAAAFLENKGNKSDVNHKNGIKTDNRVENLEWVSHSENELHKIYELKTPSKLYGNPRPVQCINTGIVYRSISEAKREMGLPRWSHIQEVCAGKISQSGGFRWRYV